MKNVGKKTKYNKKTHVYELYRFCKFHEILVNIPQIISIKILKIRD